MNAATLKLRLLLNGVQVDFAKLRGLTYKSDKHFHNNRHYVGIHDIENVPQELLLWDGESTLYTNLLVRPDSRYQLSADDDHVFVRHDGKPLDIRVSLPAEPVFWTRHTADGVPVSDMLSLPGQCELSFWTWHDCGLQTEGLGCKFCTTTQSAKRFHRLSESPLLTTRVVDEILARGTPFDSHYNTLFSRARDCITAALETDFLDRPYWFTLIGGALNPKYSDFQNLLFGRLMADLLLAVPALTSTRTVCNPMLPTNSGVFHVVKDSGTGSYMANMELWSDTALARICPGKSRYGRDRMVEMLIEATHIFGRGNVWCSFVCGLEQPEVQLKAYEDMGKYGVVCGANIFHKDPGITIDFDRTATEKAIRDYYIEAARILRDYHLQPFYSMESRRSSLLWEAYRGIL